MQQTTLMAALGVNGMVKCDCGHTDFFVGIAINPENGNNFVRVLECTKCAHQMPMVHKSDAQLAPSIVS
jgi:hypothetical protein